MVEVLVVITTIIITDSVMVVDNCEHGQDIVGWFCNSAQQMCAVLLQFWQALRSFHRVGSVVSTSVDSVEDIQQAATEAAAL